MARKIPFKVVFASDEDTDYPASELNSHSPTVHGWRSNADSAVSPKEIVLRFFHPARIVRIQVLAHQYYIRAARCPLCHDDVLLPLDGGWKRHLLSRAGCLGNTRRRAPTQ